MTQILTPDIPRLYTALAEWGACMIYCFLLPGRHGRVRSVLTAVIALFIQGLFMQLTDDVPLFFWIPCMIVAFCLMLLFLYLETRTSFINIFYYGTKSFLFAEFAASLQWQMELFFRGGQFPFRPLSVLNVICTYGAVFFAFWFLERKVMKREEAPDFSWQEAVSAALISMFTFAFSNLNFAVRDNPFGTLVMYDTFRMRTLVDLGGIAILYAFQSRILEMDIQRDYDAINGALQLQYDNYRNYQESIDLINEKYHDLKHELACLYNDDDPVTQGDALENMAEELEEYRPEQQTGSRVLDTILAGKQVRLHRAGINLTCVTDGRLLENISVKDLCTIFGNSLDNAIEHTAVVEDPEKRNIHLTVTQKKQFLFISLASYTEDAVLTQRDYGFRSIEYCVKKYDGTVTFRTKNHNFEMRVLIPM